MLVIDQYLAVAALGVRAEPDAAIWPIGASRSARPMPDRGGCGGCRAGLATAMVADFPMAELTVERWPVGA